MSGGPIQEAVALAKQAVAADEGGQHIAAMELYQQAIGLIGKHIHEAPERQKPALQKYV
jgi:hypothetical protein